MARPQENPPEVVEVPTLAEVPTLQGDTLVDPAVDTASSGLGPTDTQLSTRTSDTGDVNLSPSGSIRGGKNSFSDGTPGFWMGRDGDVYKFIIQGDGEQISFDGTTFVISGELTAGSIHIPDKDTTDNSFHVNSDGDAWWGATQTDFDADNDNATAFILKTGVARFREIVNIGNLSDTENLINSDGTTVTINQSNLNFQNSFGDGSDGNVTISGNTTLTQDMFYDTLTVDNGITLTTGGFRIFCKTKLDNNGTIDYSGNPGGDGGNGVGGNGGAGGTAGAALASGSMFGSTAGSAGGDGADSASSPDAGVAGTSAAKCLVGAGAAGGKGGDPSGSSGGNGGTAGSATGTVFNIPQSGASAYFLFDSLPSPDLLRSSAGSGGGGGGAPSATDAGGGGGGGGSAGGIVTIFARDFDNASGTISANGGAGGDGGDADPGGGAGAGGGGGNGGEIIYVYSKLTAAGVITATLGAAGSAGTGGSGGAVAASAGIAGNIIPIKV